MARQPDPPETRTVKALREAKAITGPEQDAALAALAATEPCTKCEGDGVLVAEYTDDAGTFWPAQVCERCEGTGEQRVIK